jgi:uncharacterized membrane protein
MSKLERYFIAGLVVLVVLAVAAVFVAPWLTQPDPSAAGPLEPGEREAMPARVVEVLEEGTVDIGGGETQPYQRLLLHIEGGSMAGERIVVEEGTINLINQERLFRTGDRVYLERTTGPQGDRFYISDFVRTWPLLWIAVVFVGLVVVVGRGRGARSLFGTLFSLVVIFVFIIPQIVAGRDPVLIGIVGSVALLAVPTYLTYGWRPKSHAAMIGMLLSLVLTGILAWLFVEWTHLTGLSSEESFFLVTELGQGMNFQGLVLAGVIIGSLGVLDDICVGQAAAVFELANVNRELGWRALFRSSLNIGRDHIAAMVNTLLLAYVGASLPLMLAFNIYQEPLWRRISREPIAEEIVRTLVGSIGLILAVPITGLVASLLARWAVERDAQRSET